MSPEPGGAMAPLPGAGRALAPTGSPLVTRALADLAPAARRVLVVAPDDVSRAWIGSVVAQHGCAPVGLGRPVRPSDLLACLPYEVALLAGPSVEFLAEARALLPDEIPIVYEMDVEAGRSDALGTYTAALQAGAAFVQWPHMSVGTDNLADALTLGRYLRDHPEVRGWPAPPPPDPRATRFPVVNDDGGVRGWPTLPPPDPGATRFLVVNDEAGVRDVLALQLAWAGFRVSVACHAAEALELCDEEMPDVLWTNEGMPGLCGSDLLRRLRERTRGRVPCLIDSGGLGNWRDRARLAFRCVSLPSDRRDTLSLFHEAARMRAAFRYASSPRVLLGLAGAPPPAPPS